jgi:hypothetical protein
MDATPVGEKDRALIFGANAAKLLKQQKCLVRMDSHDGDSKYSAMRRACAHASLRRIGAK